MKRITKINLLLILVFLIVFTLTSCIVKPDDPIVESCLHEKTTWVWQENAKCEKTNFKYLYCDDCGEIVDFGEEYKPHELQTEIIPATCLKDGYTITTCKNCLYEVTQDPTKALSHDLKLEIVKEATATEYGIRQMHCTRCDLVEESIEFVNNGFSTHGALHVDGVDLKDSNNEKFRLVGISSFGLQWQPEYINYSTIANFKNASGANVIRLALYTSEGGYCTGTAKKKQEMYDTVVKGINIATELDMYVIVDWHMLGADDDGDNNPLYFKDEAKVFFDKITNEFKDHDNILFEIMNEPSDCTWKDCKTYAEEVIPVIRKNMPNAIILVGNPQWTSDLASVAKDPIKNVSNIMYSFHFYADDNCMTGKIKTAIETDKLPVFVTEHGGMGSDGDGQINFQSLTSWYNILDKYNISMVAWSMSNLQTTSCIFKTGSTKLDDFSDSNLKTWGIYYIKRIRKLMGLPLTKEN